MLNLRAGRVARWATTAVGLVAAVPAGAAVTNSESPFEPGAPTRRAVVVGLNGALDPNTKPLVGAEPAAARVGKALAAAGFHQVTTLTGTDATQSRIEAQLRAMQRSGLGPDDTVVIHIITHGVVCPKQDDDGTQHLRLVDSRTGETCWTDTVTDRWLSDALAKTGAGHRVLVIDSCMSTFRPPGAAPMGVEEQQGWRGRPLHELVMRSTSWGLSAYELDEQVVYSEAFAEGITSFDADSDGDGAVTAIEAHEFAVEQVRRSGLGQVPMLDERRIADAGATILSGTPGDPIRAVLRRLPEGIYNLGAAVVPMGSGSALPVMEEGPLSIGSGPFARMRIYGLQNMPAGGTSVLHWLPGRRRGWPSVQLAAGGLLGTPQVATLPAQPAATATTVRLHEQLTPELYLVAETGGLGTVAPRLVAAGGPSFHWRAWTLTGGARVGSVALRTDDPDAIAEGRGLTVGAELGVRRGLAAGLALDIAVVHDRGKLAYEGGTEALGLTELRAGVLLDPAVWAAAR